MAVISLPYGEEFLPVEIADAWLGEVAMPRPVTPVADVTMLVRQALRQPVGSPRLERLARSGQRVVILVDDYTRRTPADQILPPILAELSAAGVRREDIRLLIASGSHRSMTEAEVAAKLGVAIPCQYEVIQISSDDDAQMVYLGVTSNGIPAWVNRAVVEADLCIGVGMITPHMDAGFSGGGKIILPGACGSRTVDAFHARQMDDPDNQLGNLDAPLHRDLEQFVGEQRRSGRVDSGGLLDFIINVITTIDEQVYQCVAGHFIRAHRAGVVYARQAYGVALKRRYPVVIAGSYPHHQDLWQSIKALWSGDLMVADGGRLILVTPAPEGFGGYPLLAEFLSRDPIQLRSELESGRLADPKCAATALMIQQRRKRLKLGLVSSGFSRSEAKRMGMAYYYTVEAAIQEAVDRLPKSQQYGAVGVLTHGGVLLPMISVK